MRVLCEDCGKLLTHVAWVREAPTKEREDWNKPMCYDCYVAEYDREPYMMPALLEEEK